VFANIIIKWLKGSILVLDDEHIMHVKCMQIIKQVYDEFGNKLLKKQEAQGPHRSPESYWLKYFAYKNMQSHFSLLLPQLLQDHDFNNLILH
jgi:hypothetical protein